MVILPVLAYRRREDNDMVAIDNFQERHTHINPLFVVSVKPTAVNTDMTDIMTLDGMVYRVYNDEPKLHELLDRVSQAIRPVQMNFMQYPASPGT